MDTPKYVMSIIRLPLLIHDDGTYTTLHDSIRMEFEPCPELPQSPSPEQQHESTARLTALIADLCQDPSPTTLTQELNPALELAQDQDQDQDQELNPEQWPVTLDRSAIRRRVSRPTTFKHYSSMANASDPTIKRRHTMRNL